jgi:hypothetical protein
MCNLSVDRAKESTTPSLFMNVLCCMMAGKDFGGSPLIQRSRPVSLIMKVLCDLAHLIWFLVKDTNARNCMSPMKGPRFSFLLSSKMKLWRYSSHKKYFTFSSFSLKHETNSETVVNLIGLPSLIAFTLNNK